MKRIVIIDEPWIGDEITYAVRATLPQVIEGLAGGDYVVTNTITSAMQGVAEPDYYDLAISYDPEVSDVISVTTNGAGRLFYNVSKGATQAAAEIVAHTAQVDEAYGYIDTYNGPISLPLPDSFTSDDDLFLHIVLVNPNAGNAVISRTAHTRIHVGGQSQAAQFTFLSGSGQEYDYTNGDGTFKAYRITDNARIRVTRAGSFDVEWIAGGGQGGGQRRYYAHGAGGAGGYKLRNIYLAVGEYDIVIGKGGRAATGNSQPGGDTEAFGVKVTGGGRGGSAPKDDPDRGVTDGGSGGGAYGMNGSAGLGIADEGYDGGGGFGNAGGGGGGAGGPATGGSDKLAGNGGPGVTTTILGFPEDVCGGGAGSGNTATTLGTATHGGGNPVRGALNAAVMDGSAPGAGGAGAPGPDAEAVRGGYGANGRVVLRIKVA